MVLGRRIRGTRVEVAPPMAMAVPLPQLPALLLLRRPPPLAVVARGGAAFPREPPGLSSRRRLGSQLRSRQRVLGRIPAAAAPLGGVGVARVHLVLRARVVRGVGEAAEALGVEDGEHLRRRPLRLAPLRRHRAELLLQLCDLRRRGLGDP